ncbi:pH-response regulator protein palC [Aulographum hederae CBS 113979]|uniref:pH-response regulator protein palC n=1 Tax=Aulographum hederae CBS 113979 TaxID=1176131 RepID=A0A6G1H999_9PEZI|nr:pH-response regulator protein palC [Aulographum hederae CBS 113979]
MPFPFLLPTISHVSFSDFFSSSTHPSLPLAATSSRSVVRDTLKRQKRLPPQSQASSLPNVLAALNEYIPYLLALDAGLSGARIAEEEVDVALIKELEVEWRATLTASIPGREPPRIKLRSLDVEIFFALSTLAYTNSLLARSHLHILYNGTVTTTEQRGIAISSAMKYLLEAHSIHSYLVTRAAQWTAAPATVDISQAMLNALASLTLAEATLITVYKDDPYPAAVAEDRNPNSKDWMFKNPEIPKVRAHLYARLCLAAAEHATRAQAGLGGANKINEDFVQYIDDLRRTAKGKACRFLGIDSELSGKTGEGIAWLRGAKKEMGFVVASAGEDKKFKGLSKLKKDWAEKKEDRKVMKGGDWGSDAGKFEEGRVLDMLEKKWVKENDTINVQLIPPSEPLLANLPSGREYHNPKPYQPPMLAADVIVRMRAPPDPSDAAFRDNEDDSGAEDDGQIDPVGVFPGTKTDYAASGSAYY